jgi:hypothetical protein
MNFAPERGVFFRVSNVFVTASELLSTPLINSADGDRV